VKADHQHANVIGVYQKCLISRSQVWQTSSETIEQTFQTL